MKNFNIKRFWQTLKWQILYHKAKDIKRLLTCACEHKCVFVCVCVCVYVCVCVCTCEHTV